MASALEPAQGRSEPHPRPPRTAHAPPRSRQSRAAPRDRDHAPAPAQSSLDRPADNSSSGPAAQRTSRHPAGTRACSVETSASQNSTPSRSSPACAPAPRASPPPSSPQQRDPSSRPRETGSTDPCDYPPTSTRRSDPFPRHPPGRATVRPGLSDTAGTCPNSRAPSHPEHPAAATRPTSTPPRYTRPRRLYPASGLPCPLRSKAAA